MIHARRSRCYVGEHSPRQAASAPHWRSTESSPSSLVPTPPPPTKVCPSTELYRDACRERSADQGPTSLSRERPLQLENTPEIDKDPLPDRLKGSHCRFSGLMQSTQGLANHPQSGNKARGEMMYLASG